MLHLTLRGPATFGSDRDAVETLEIPGRAKAWFDGEGRVCKLVAPAKLDLELTPDATGNPIIAQLIRDQGGDPAEWAEASHTRIPRRRVRVADLRTSSW